MYNLKDMERLKSVALYFLNKVYPDNVDAMKKSKKIVFYSCFFFLLSAFFVSVLFQNPVFVQKNLNLFSNMIWIPLIMLLICLDYKQFFKSLVLISAIIIPFLTYLFIAFFFQHSVIALPFVRSIFIIIILLLIGSTYSPYKNRFQIKCFSLAYIIASFILVIVVYFTSLRGQDFSSQIYSYGTKNSTGPILLIACVLSLNVFEKNKPVNNVCIILVSTFFIIAIALMKSRTALSTAPIIFYIIFTKKCKNNMISLILLFSFIGILILLFAVPYFRNNIIVNLLLNGKTDLDSILSGRITGILDHLNPSNYIVGNMSGYVDCMPINIYYNFGILGFLSLLPLLIFPYFVIHKARKNEDAESPNVLLLLIVLLTINSLFEAYGFLGPGVKVFAFWVFLGFEPSWVWSGSKAFKPFNKLALNKKLLSKKVFSVFLESAMIAIMVALALPQVSNPISKRIYNTIPSSSETVEYVRIKSIEIVGSHTMCVGQTVHFEARINPSNATDSGVFWTGWGANDYLNIDRNNGTVFAKEISTVNLCCASKKETGIYSLFSISTVQPSQYEFKDFVIYANTKEIMLDMGDTQTISFSKDYVPNSVEVSFYSSNNDVATIDKNGTIRGVSYGTCDVYACITNDVGTFESNRIPVTISNKQGITVTELSIEMEEECSIETPVTYTAEFNYGVNDTGLFAIVDGGERYLCGSSFVFDSPGEHSISFISRNNESIVFQKRIYAKENSVKKIIFEGDGWAKIGEKINVRPTLLFNDGYKRPAIESDLNITYDTSKRAWHNKNGLCDNEFTFAAITTGDSRINYYYKNNPSINLAIELTISNISFAQYNKLIKQIGFVVLCISLLPSLIVFLTLDIGFRKKWFWIFAIFMIGVPSLSFVLVNLFNPITIGCLIFVDVMATAVIIFSIISTKKINILCEPNSNYFKEKIQNEFYMMSI